MYEIVIILFALFAFAEIFSKNNPNKPVVWFVCFCLLVFHDGFRWETGTDWIPYYDYFMNCFEPNNQGVFEVGYELLVRSIRLFTEEYSVYLIIHALIFYSLIFVAIRKYSVSPFVSLFLFYCSTLPLLGMNRQFLAVAVCLFSIQFVVQKKTLYFLVAMVVAVLFHKSALIFLIVYFLNKELKPPVYLMLFLIVIVISFSGVINKLPLQLFVLAGDSAVDRMDEYADKFIYGEQLSLLNSILGVLKRILWLVILFAFSKYVKNRNQYFTILFNMYFLASLLYIVFNNTILQIVVSRGLSYFSLAEIFIIPYVLTIFKNNVGKICIFFLMLTYSTLMMKKGINSYSKPGEDSIFYPYKGLFINSDYNRKVY